MKRVLTLILALVLVLGLCACGEKKAEGNKSFDCLAVGVGRADITPKNPIGAHINGGGDPNRLAQGILDDLAVTCVAVTDETNKTVLFFHQDIHNPSAESFTNDSRKAVSEATGVPFENVYMSGTHTHSSLHPRDTTNAQNEEFNAQYDKAIVAAAKAAMKDRAPATMYAGTMDAKAENGGQAMAFVRHYLHKDGSVAGSNFGTYRQSLMCGFPYEADNEAQLIKFTREGKNDVLMMNWPAHSTYHGTTTKLNISGDYPVYLRRYIEENSDATVAIFLAGAGDQTPHSELYPVANHGLNCEQYGAKLGELVLNFMAVEGNMAQVEDGVIKQETYVLTADSNFIPEEQADLAAKAQDVYDYFLQNGQADGNTYAIANGFQSCYEARSFVSRLELEPTQTIPLYVMSLGNMSFAIAPYEMSGQTATEIKHTIKDGGQYDMAFIMAYSQDNIGYIPSASNYEYNGGRGSYEAYDCKYAKGTAEAIADTYVQLLTDLKAK